MNTLKDLALRLAFGAAMLGAILLLSQPIKAADKGEGYYDPTTIAAEAPTRKSLWTGFYVEGGVGVTSSTVAVGITGFGDLFDMASTDWAGHIGIGYDYMVSPHIVVGVLARAMMTGADYKVLYTKVGDRDIEYMIGGRVGWVPRSDWMVYGLVGYQFAQVDLVGGMPDADQDSWVLGAGIEGMLTDHWFLGIEATTNLADGDSLSGVTVEATDYTGKVRVGWKF